MLTSVSFSLLSFHTCVCGTNTFFIFSVRVMEMHPHTVFVVCSHIVIVCVNIKKINYVTNVIGSSPSRSKNHGIKIKMTIF